MKDPTIQIRCVLPERQIEAALEGLGPERQAEILAKGIREGVAILAADARQHAPVLQGHKKGRTPGTLRGAIKSSTRKGKPDKWGGTARGAVTLSNFGDAFYGPWVERGHRWCKRPGGGKRNPKPDNRKWIPGRYFMAGALERAGERAVEATVNTILAEVA